MHSIVSKKAVVALGTVASLAATAITPALANNPAEGPMNTESASAEESSAGSPNHAARKERLAKTLSDYERIARNSDNNLAAGSEGHARLLKYLQARLESVGYTVEVKRTFSSDKRAYVVVAYFEDQGADDSIVVGTNITPKEGSPGVNAVWSSVAASLEVAERFAAGRKNLYRPVRFVFLGDTNERLTGLEYYKKRSDVSLRKIHSYYHLQNLATPGSKTLISGHRTDLGLAAQRLKRSVQPFAVETRPGSFSGQLSELVSRTFQMVTVGGQDECLGLPCDTLAKADIDVLAYNSASLMRMFEFAAGLWFPGNDGSWGGGYSLTGPARPILLGLGSQHFTKIGVRFQGGVVWGIGLPRYTTDFGVKITPEKYRVEPDKEVTVALQVMPGAVPGMHQIAYGQSGENVWMRGTYTVDVPDRWGGARVLTTGGHACI